MMRRRRAMRVLLLRRYNVSRAQLFVSRHATKTLSFFQNDSRACGGVRALMRRQRRSEREAALKHTLLERKVPLPTRFARRPPPPSGRLRPSSTGYGGRYCGALSALPHHAALTALRATLSPKCAPQEQKNWRRSCAAECGSSTRQRSSMSSPQPGQRGAASEYRDTLLLRIVLMSNLLTVFCIGARESANHAFDTAV